MENTDKKTTAENEHPKPTEDVQMEIETVIPSTAEDAIEERKNAFQDEDTKPQEEQETAEKAANQDVKKDEAVQSKSVENEEKTENDSPEVHNSPDNEKKDGDDERDQIETITPSA
ncbi:hypothetical protein ACJVDH_14210 [Pedobacter sp. AW1-32]|uniref:hypothetical protein n=1 Tax=Pedobacter sp. AW1-32 TaxID=3383026 RepID=UPI003FEEFC76